MKNLNIKPEECWGLNYHVYDYLVKGGSLNNAFEKWDNRVVLYFYNWISEDYNKTIKDIIK